MSVFDLRQWLADADSAGELQHVRGADAVLEIGAASQLNYRRKRPLERQGVIVVPPRRRPYVSSVTLKQVKDLYDLRACLFALVSELIVDTGPRGGLAAPGPPRTADQEDAP
jgi:hypothetical protein